MDTITLPASVTKHILESDEPLWREWLQIQERTHDDLRKLISSAVRLGFKVRALIVLLWKRASPPCPVFWQGSGRDHNISFLHGMGKRLWPIASALACRLVDATPALSQEQEFLQRCILSLLSYPGDDVLADQLYKRFMVLEQQPYNGMDDTSRYEPFERLLADPGIDERLKRRADASMRDIVFRELRGETAPREKWEDALQCYVDAVRRQIPRDEEKAPAYSLGLLADQLMFLLESWGERGDLRRFHDLDMLRAIELLKPQQFGAVRLALARSVFLRSNEPFRGCGAGLLAAVIRMRDDAAVGGADHHLRSALDAVIAELQPQVAQQDMERQQRQQRAAEIDAEMRRQE